MTLYSFPYAAHGIREGWFVGFLSFYARMAGGLLHLFDAGVHVVGVEIVGRTTLTVAKNCDAMDINILFAAAVVAFPARWSRRAVGLALGLPALALVNIIRIATLYFVELRAPAAFEVVHAEVWPLALVALAVAAFLVWSRWAEPGAAEA
jgi:exosortase/archaeosortase family protein